MVDRVLLDTTLITLRADGAEETRTIQAPEYPGYVALQDLLRPILGCNFAERVKVLHDGQVADLFVDEDGIGMGLPRNEKATAIYRNNTLTQAPQTDPESLECVYGDAVLFLRPVWN
jgi:hypothetical protein